MSGTTAVVAVPSRARRLLARLLVVAGVALVTIAVGARTAAVVQSEAGLAAFAQANPAPAAEPRDPAGWQSLAVDQSQWAPGRVSAWKAALALAAPTPLAVLRIPRLGLEVPVWDGIDEGTLNRGVGIIPDTAPVDGGGNTGLAGHRDGFFRVLEGIAKGDVMELDTPAGTQEFTVTDTWIVEQESVWVLDPTQERSLTLVTCYPFRYVGRAPNRFIVRARVTGGGPERTQGGADATPVTGRQDALW
jgi:sortase A